MIYILHGDDTVSSRKFIDTLVVGKLEQLDGKTLNKSTLEEKTLSGSLFGEEKTVLVENLFLKNKSKKEIIEFLKSTKPIIPMIFWEDGKVRKNSITLKNATVREFSFPSYYFDFLDSLRPLNSKTIFQLFQKNLVSSSPEQLFYSMLKRIRELLLIKKNKLNISSPWLENKLREQSNLWSAESLKKVYLKLVETEIQLKSGGLPVSLSKHLDTIILSEI